MKKYIVIIPKCGTLIDDNAFGGFCVDKSYQERFKERAIKQWKSTIQCEYKLSSKRVEENGVPHFEYFYEKNPYYGWKENQLKFVIQ